MNRTNTFTKALAVAGEIFAWLPIAATVVITLVAWIASGMFRLDFLMPAELAWAAFIGGGLLLWAALRAHARRGLIAGGLALMLIMLVGGQALAEVSGLASGAREPTGWAWAMVLAALALYTLGIVEVGTAGALLVRDVFRGSARPSTDG